MDHSFGAVVYTEEFGNRLYLLVLHTDGAHWDFPKGHPIINETTTETIMREVKEETGNIIEMVSNHQETIEYILTSGETKQVHFQIAKRINSVHNKIPNNEIRGIGWFTFAEAVKTITFDNSRNILINIDKYIQDKIVK